MTNEAADYVWCDSVGQGRNLYGLFRRSLLCAGPPARGELNIFADTVYHLYVNGRFVNLGPTRFDPRSPLHDHYDLTPLLVPGKNTLAVMVNHFGCETYKSIPAGAGLLAWGEVVEADGTRQVIATGRDAAWLSCPCEAYDRNAPKLSFALNPMELVDLAKLPPDWQAVTFDARDWPQATVLDRQDTWGPLAPRSTPLLNGDEFAPERLIGVFPLQPTEDLYSFVVPVLDVRAHREPPVIAFSAWLFSPCEQEVTAGLFWGEHWLNGVALGHRIPAENSSLKYHQRLSLRAGWNYFFGKVGAYPEEFAFYLTLPKGKGLILSATQDEQDPAVFRHSALIPGQAFADYCARQPLPYPAEETLDAFGGWQPVPRATRVGTPGRDCDLDAYGPRFLELTPGDLVGKVFRKADFPEGFAIVLDLGHTQLFRTSISASGTAGATVDLAFSERLRGNKPQLYLNHTYQAACRARNAGPELRWSSFHPYGARYVALTVRNPQADITLHELRFTTATYPVEPKGAFACSDPALNAIWELCRRTQATNMEDAYVDCPTRERGMYGRDTLIQYRNNLAFFGDQPLMRRCLELYAQSPAPDGKFRAVYPSVGDYTIADFALNMVDGFLDYYENSGDLALIQTSWAAIVRNLQWFHELSDERPDGLLDADWPQLRGLKAHYGGYHADGSVPDSHMCKTGPSCALTCAYLSALKSAMPLAELAGDRRQRRLLAGRYRRLKTSLSTSFWDPATACFADDLAKSTHSVHANALAVLASVCSPVQTRGIRAHLKNNLKSVYLNGYSATGGELVSAHFMYYVLAALYRLKLPAVAEALIVEGWGDMLASGLTTCREYFGKAGDSFCHAWSAHPGYFLSRHVLGVNFPKAPDLDIVEIDIQTARVTWATGAYPHPRGTIEVEWRMQDGRRIVETKAPPGVVVVVKH